MASELPWPHGDYGVWADDDDVIGLTVARTHPAGFFLIRTEPPFMDAFDEFEVAKFLAWCLSTKAIHDEWTRHGGDDTVTERTD